MHGTSLNVLIQRILKFNVNFYVYEPVRRRYVVRRRRFCDEFVMVSVFVGTTVAEPMMKSLYHWQYLSTPTT